MIVTAAISLPVAAADAQELPPPPPYPDAPQVTEPLQDAWQAGSDAFVPAADLVLSELGLAAHLAGPALRPECSAVGSLVVASFLAAGYTPVPLPLGAYVIPVQVFCLSAYNVGTIDYVLRDVDAAVGPTVSDASDAAVAPAADALGPAHDQAAPACGYSPLVSSPLAQVPPPLNRVPFFDLVCGPPG